MARGPEGIVVGVDLGGTKTAVGSADLSGHLLHALKVPTAREAGPEGIVRQMADLVHSAVAGSGRTLKDVVAIGVGAPGPTSAAQGVVFTAPNLPGWRDVPLRRLLEEALGLPVRLDNDANAAAIAEHRWGAGRGIDDMIYITVSTGIGGGLILGGRLYHGGAETAGEIGHTTIDFDGPPCSCGSRGCLEAMASGRAIARRAVEALRGGAESAIRDLVRGDLGAVTAGAVGRAARTGDELAVSLLEEAGRYLGVGIANLTNLLAPRLVAVGGGVGASGEMLLAPARAVVRLRAFSHPGSVVEIVQTGLGRDVGVLGAVALALGLDQQDF